MQSFSNYSEIFDIAQRVKAKHPCGNYEAFLRVLYVHTTCGITDVAYGTGLYALVGTREMYGISLTKKKKHNSETPTDSRVIS